MNRDLIRQCIEQGLFDNVRDELEKETFDKWSQSNDPQEREDLYMKLTAINEITSYIKTKYN